MKIVIKDDDFDGKFDIIISDENLNNDNFVNLKVAEYEVQPSIEELYSAIKAFYEKRTRRQKHDNLLI